MHVCAFVCVRLLVCMCVCVYSLHSLGRLVRPCCARVGCAPSGRLVSRGNLANRLFCRCGCDFCYRWICERPVSHKKKKKVGKIHKISRIEYEDVEQPKPKERRVESRQLKPGEKMVVRKKSTGREVSKNRYLDHHTEKGIHATVSNTLAQEGADVYQSSHGSVIKKPSAARV